MLSLPARPLALLASGLLLTLGASAGARAATSHTPGASAAYSRCIDKADGTTAGIADCQTTELTRQNAALNGTYKALMHRLSAPAKLTLREEERNWIQQRDAKCAVAAQADEGGSASGLDAQECQISETAARTQVLKGWHG